MTKRYYEDFERGDSETSPTGRTISESEVYTVAGLEGNYSRLHTNAEYMAETDFGGRIAQNTLLILLSNGLNNTLTWDPETIAAYGRENIRFVNPVLIGDTVSLESEVVDKRDRDENSGIVSFREQLYNQDDELTITGDYLMLVEKAP